MIARIVDGEARLVLESPEDVWTATERNLPLWDILEFFPREAVGARGPADTPRPYDVCPVTIATDLGWDFESDIQYGSWVFRPRSPKLPGMMRYCRERGLAPGDALVFARSGEGRFTLRRERPPEAGGAS